MGEMVGDKAASQRAAQILHHNPTALVAKRGSPRKARPVVGGAIKRGLPLAVTRNDEGVFMKRSWTAMAVALSAMFAAIGCNDYGNTFQVPTGATIVALSPANIAAGSPQFTLTIIPAPTSGFVAKTVVQWNGGTIPTQLQTDSSGNVIGVTATVAASLVAKPGTAFVNTLSPHSGAGTNGLSNPLAFIINPPGNPLPAVSSLSPSCTVAGGAAFTLSVTGTNFLPTSDPSGGSQIQWSAGGTQTALPMVSGGSATQVQGTVSGTLIAASGTASVTVFNPPAPGTGTGNGGGGTSPTSLPFTVAATSCPAGSARPAAAARSVGEQTTVASADGRFAAFTATQDAHTQVFVRDTCRGAVEFCQARTLLVSSANDGAPGNQDSLSPSLSADGRYVAFSSEATNLVPGASPGAQIYLRDTCLGARTSCAPSTQLISTDPQGALAGTEAISPSVSGSGRFVTFVAVMPSRAANGFRQVFVRDTCLATTNCTPTTRPQQ
jgi:hypothetical protein